MKLNIPIALSALALLSAAAAPAEACSFARYFWPWEETLARARAAEDMAHSDEYDFVFLARVRTVRQTPMQDGVTEMIEFDVTGVLKGDVPKLVTAVNVAQNSSCGIALSPPAGQLTLVFAKPIAGSSNVEQSNWATGDFARSILAAFARMGVKPKPP